MFTDVYSSSVQQVWRRRGQERAGRKKKFREYEDIPREVFWGEARDGGSFPAVRCYGSKGAEHYTDYGSLSAFQHF
jgi:hypothetical protein